MKNRSLALAISAFTLAATPVFAQVRSPSITVVDKNGRVVGNECQTKKAKTKKSCITLQSLSSSLQTVVVVPAQPVAPSQSGICQRQGGATTAIGTVCPN